MVRGFGNPDYGKLGTDSRPAGFTGPQDIEVFLGKDVVQLEVGRAHCFALQAQFGRIFGFGSNAAQALCLRKSLREMTEPYTIRGFSNEHITQVAASKTGSHNLALSNSGKVYTWGSSADGALGQDASVCNTEGTEGGNKKIYRSCLPSLLRFTGSIPIKQIAAGGRFSVLLSTGGVIYVFGENTRGQLGIGAITVNMPRSKNQAECRLASKTKVVFDETQRRADDFEVAERFRVGDLQLPKRVQEPIMLPGSKLWTQIAAGDDHVIAVSADAEWYGWGGNYCGQLGIGISRLYEDSYLDMSLGASHTVVLTKNLGISEAPRVALMGSNSHGQLGTGPTDKGRVWPTFLPLTEHMGGFLSLADKARAGKHKKVVTPNYFCSVAAAANHTFLITRKGAVWCMGDNSFGQLGFRNDRMQPWQFYEPTVVPSLGMHQVRQISTGESHTIILAG